MVTVPGSRIVQNKLRSRSIYGRRSVNRNRCQVTIWKTPALTLFNHRQPNAFLAYKSSKDATVGKDRRIK